MENKTAAVIGGGFAGLVTAKTFKEYGFTVTIFEKETEVGGVWASSRRYPGVTTQNNKDTYYLSDLKMPKSYPEWPQGHQVQAYLEQYVDHCQLRPLLRLQTEVKSATLTADETWLVEWENVQIGAVDSAIFDLLLICNGVFSKPLIPAYPGSDVFTANGGVIYHTSQFNEAAWSKNKHVAVVGFGKSSCDAAAAVSNQAASTHLVARHLIWKFPKKLMGKVNVKYILLTRFGEKLFPYFMRRGAEKIIHGPLKPLRNAIMRGMATLIARQQKLTSRGMHPGTLLETVADATASLETDHFYQKIETGEIQVHKTEIKQLGKGKALLADGTEIPLDLLVCGTGWQQQIPFLDKAVMNKLLDENGDFRLYRSQLPFGVPGLGLNGYNASLFAPLSSEIGALWLAEYFTGGLTLEPEDLRKQYTDAYLAWSKQRTNGKNCRGTLVSPFSLHHIDEMLGDMNAKLGAFTLLKQWLLPVNSDDYKPIRLKKLAQFRRERAGMAMKQAVKETPRPATLAEVV